MQPRQKPMKFSNNIVNACFTPTKYARENCNESTREDGFGVYMGSGLISGNNNSKIT